MTADTKRVRPSDEAAAMAEHELAESVREQARLIMQTPVERLERIKVEADLKKAKPHRLTMVAFVDRVHAKLLHISPANAQHAKWLKKQFIGDR